VGEIIAFEQQRLAALPGQGISKAIAEIERGRMTPFAEAAIRRAGDPGLFLRDGHDLNPEMRDELIEPLAQHRIVIGIDHDRRFEIIGRRHFEVAVLAEQDGKESGRFRLLAQQADEDRRIDDQRGIPRSS
jgi:hypothetical protein